MFVCGLSFFLTLLCGLDFTTVQYVPRRTAPELSNSIKNVLSSMRADIIPSLALMDGEFEKHKARLAHLIEVNTTGKNKHVNEAERKIHVVKERCRCVKNDMTFEPCQTQSSNTWCCTA
ncbi:hypothetical protein ACHAWF_001905 [Thalassiosira exigua]